MQDSEDERQPPDVIVSDTDNATTIQPEEAAPHKKKKFERFRAYNTGMWNGPKRENTEQFRRQDNLHRFDALSSSLSLTDYQKKRGRNLLDEINLQNLGVRVDAVIFAICVLVTNDDGSRYYPNSSGPDDEEFASVAESISLTQRQQISTVEKIRSLVDF